MFPDDDLGGLGTCALNKVFALARALDLLIAQPAVCRDGERSYTFHDVCYAHPGYVARFSNFVEIMAPVVRWDLWSEVLRWTLDRSWTGMGLDWGERSALRSASGGLSHPGSWPTAERRRAQCRSRGRGAGRPRSPRGARTRRREVRR